MIDFPPLPTWDGLHPLIIHFPVALLMVAPLLVVAALIWRKNRTGFLMAAMLLMVLGTAATWVAVSSGEAAGRLAERNAEINAVLEHHEELGETARTVFTVLTGVFVALLAAPRLLRRIPSRGVQNAILAAFLVVWGAGTLVLTNTAHNGGRLVHELGVRAMMAPSPLPPTGAEDHDDD
jgi:uncharacterized membrane protein